MAPSLAILDGINGSEVLIIGMISLMLFGSKRLPDVARTIGKALREVRRATDGIQQNLRDSLREDSPAPKVRTPPRRGPSRTIALPKSESTTPPTAPSTPEDSVRPTGGTRVVESESADALPYRELASSEEAEPRLRGESHEDVAN